MNDPRKQEDLAEQQGESSELDEAVDAAETEAAEAAEAAEPENGAEAAADSQDGKADEDEPPSELDLMRAERDALQEKWLRVVAELDNVRKRSRREVVDARRLAQADVLRSLLDVQDNFERALQSFADETDTGSNEGLRDGVQLIYDSFLRLLADRGVESIPAQDEEFDPAVHEAVGQLAREGVETGMVVEVLQQGYKLGDLVLRPARVMVSS